MAAIAQTNPDAGKYFNFALRSSSTPAKTYLQGSLVVSGTTGQFSSLSTPSATYYAYNASGNATVYGVTSATAWSGTEGTTTYTSSSVGGYAAGTGQLAGTYYVNRINLGFTTTAGSHFVAVGSVNAAGAANFDLYNATYSNGSYTLGSPVVSQEKMVASGTFTDTSGFSTTALASDASVPEIDGGTLPRALLLIFLSFVMLRAWASYKRTSALTETAETLPHRGPLLAAVRT